MKAIVGIGSIKVILAYHLEESGVGWASQEGVKATSGVGVLELPASVQSLVSSAQMIVEL